MTLSEAYMERSRALAVMQSLARSVAGGEVSEEKMKAARARYMRANAKYRELANNGGDDA